MSLFCAISGQPPLHPVLSIKSGHVYEKDLVLKYLRDNDSKDPITGDVLTEDDLVVVKTAPSTPSAPPRPPTFTSVPSLLHVLQNEWDATMLECLELRRAGAELRQELSHALYKEDASLRVLARVARERDEAREALASVRESLGMSSAPQGAADIEMEAAAPDVVQADNGLKGDARTRVEESLEALSAPRKKRKPSPSCAPVADIKSYGQITVIPSYHGTKPPGVSAIDLGKSGSLVLTGGLDKAVQIYDRSTSKIMATLKGHTKKVTAVHFSTTLTSEGLPSHVISSSLDKSVRVFAPNGAKGVYGMAANLAIGSEVNALAMHPSSTLVASANADGSISIHDLLSEKPATILTIPLVADAAPGTSNTAIAFHPDGAMIGVGSSDSSIRIFQVLTGELAATFAGVEGGKAISSLTFSENGYILASSAVDSSIVSVWDLRKLTNVHQIDLPTANVINAVKFDPSAQYLVAVGTDVRVFMNKTWEELVVVEDNTAEITGVEWGVDSKEIAVSGMDRTIRIIGVPVAE